MAQMVDDGEDVRFVMGKLNGGAKRRREVEAATKLVARVLRDSGFFFFFFRFLEEGDDE